MLPKCRWPLRQWEDWASSRGRSASDCHCELGTVSALQATGPKMELRGEGLFVIGLATVSLHLQCIPHRDLHPTSRSWEPASGWFIKSMKYSSASVDDSVLFFTQIFYCKPSLHHFSVTRLCFLSWCIFLLLSSASALKCLFLPFYKPPSSNRSVLLTHFIHWILQVQRERDKSLSVSEWQSLGTLH